MQITENERENMQKEQEEAQKLNEELDISNEEKQEIDTELDTELQEEGMDIDGITEEDKRAANNLTRDAKATEELAKTPITEIEKRNKDKEELKQAKKEWKDAKKDLKQLHNEYLRQSAIAEMNVKGSPEHENSIKEMKNLEQKIYEQTKKVEETKINFQRMKPSVIEEIKSVAKATHEKIKKGLTKIDIIADRKIENGKQGIRRMTKAVARANERFKTRGKTAYKGIEEKGHKIYRSVLAADYKLDKMQLNVVNGTKKLMESAFKGVNEVANRAENVKNAIMGKSFNSQKPMTQSQQAVINFFDDKANDIQKNMKTTELEYKSSLEQSKNRTKELAMERNVVGLSVNNQKEAFKELVDDKDIGSHKTDLRKKMEAAVKAAANMNKSKPNKGNQNKDNRDER